MKPKKPLKPFKNAIWSQENNRWEGTPPSRAIGSRAVGVRVGRRTRIPSVSAKRYKTNQEYNRVKVAWRRLAENQFCRRCLDNGLERIAENYPHHKKGRIGSLLCDARFFMPICVPCHAFIHDNKSVAYDKGYLLKH